MPTSSDKLWVVHIGNNDEVAQRAQTEGFVCIGWTRMGDLAPNDNREKARAAYEQTYPDADRGKVNASYGQPYRFAQKMKVGDTVVYPVKGSRFLYIGRISGDYEFRSGDADLVKKDYCNVRPVEWLARDVPRIAFSAAALHSFGSLSSVSTSDDFLDEVQTVLRNGGTVPAPAAVPATTPEDPADADAVETDAGTVAADAELETEDYLLKRWSRTAQDFEHVVAAVLRAMGYTARVGPGTRDGGVDIVAHLDPLGVQPPTLKVQVKSGTTPVGSPAVNQLRGSVQPGQTGLLVGLGGFSTDAKQVQQHSSNVVLIDGERFVELFLSTTTVSTRKSATASRSNACLHTRWRQTCATRLKWGIVSIGGTR